jgi:hypothetical protein
MKKYIDNCGELEFKLVDDELAFKQGEATPFRIYHSVSNVLYYAWVGLIMIIVDDDDNVLAHWHTLDADSKGFDIVEKIPEDELRLMVKRQKAFT